MRFTDAIRWGLYDRLLAAVSALLGLGLAFGGLWVGTSDWVSSILSGNPGATPGGTDAAIAFGGILLGLFVWQVGSAAARHRTMVTATKRELAGRADVPDADAGAGDEADRLAQLESDVEEVRRVAARIEQSMRAGEFDADGLDGSAGAASGASDAASTTERNAPEIEFSDESSSDGSAAAAGSASASAADESGGAASGAAAAATDDEAVVDGGAVAAADGDDADDAAEAADATASADGATGAEEATAGEGASAGDGFEWPEEEEDEYYRNS